MEQLEVTWGRTLIVWWSFVWRADVFSAIVGMVLGFVGGVVVVLMGKSEWGALVGAVLGYLGSIPVSICVMKIILEKRFNKFTVVLVKDVEAGV
ncbi:MAG: hypothetical protein WD226_03465 [Planctomycetota bacterium]